MSDTVAPLPGMVVTRPAQKSFDSTKRISKAVVTMKSFTQSSDHMKVKFDKMAKTADYKRNQADMVAKYDTNGDGHFDRNEVLAICRDVAFKSFVEKENVAGAQRMAEALNTTKAKSKMFRNGMIAFMAVSIALIAVIGGMMYGVVEATKEMKVSASGAATTVDGRTLTMKAAPQGTSTSMIRPSKSADGGSRLLSTRTIDPEHAKLTPQEFHARGLHLKHARKLNEDDPAAALMNGNGEDSMFLSTQELQLLEGTADKVADGSATLEMKKAYYELALRHAVDCPAVFDWIHDKGKSTHEIDLFTPGFLPQADGSAPKALRTKPFITSKTVSTQNEGATNTVSITATPGERKDIAQFETTCFNFYAFNETAKKKIRESEKYDKDSTCFSLEDRQNYNSVPTGYKVIRQAMCANLWYLEAFMPAPERSELIVQRGIYGQNAQDCAAACDERNEMAGYKECHGFEFNNVDGAEECILVNDGCKKPKNWVNKNRAVTLQMDSPYCMDDGTCDNKWKFGPYDVNGGFPEIANKRIYILKPDEEEQAPTLSDFEKREARWNSFKKAFTKMYGNQAYDPSTTAALLEALETGDRAMDVADAEEDAAFSKSKGGGRRRADESMDAMGGDKDMGGDEDGSMDSYDCGCPDGSFACACNGGGGDGNNQVQTKSTTLSSHQKLLIEQELVIDKSNYMQAIKDGQMVCITKLSWSNEIMSQGSRRRRLAELGSENHHGPLKRRLAGGADNC